MPPGASSSLAAAATFVALLAAAIIIAAAADDQPQVAADSPSPQSQEAAPEAQVQQGRMFGTVLLSRGGRRIYAFRGIPYAQPPLGELRFQAPLPAKPWDGVLNASTDGSDCVQKNYLVPPYPVTGSEDCLFLNVFTPKMAPPISHLPVIVYIHGGGFFAGSGASHFNGPQYLLDHDVVLVTINYRLGALGFLSSGDARAPGNAGLKDQSLALRWVQHNVAAFGGDPHRVTIMGQSAGAASVHLHLLSPLSRGLFQRAISQSGSALSAWAVPRDPAPITLQQAEFMECGAADMEAALRCLRRVDAHALTESGHRFHFWSIDPLTVFRPVVEKSRPGAFLLDHPAAIMQAGDFAHVPWLMGSVTQEGIVRSLPILVDAQLTADLNARWDEIMPRLMELEHSAPAQEVPAIWRNISDFYFGDANPRATLANFQPFTDLYSDRAFLFPMRRAVELHARAGHQSVFLYEFAFRGNHSYSLLYGGGVDDYGVAHCDDLLYLLYAPALFPNMPAAGSGDERALEAFTQMWVNFAERGEPTTRSQTAKRSLTASQPSGRGRTRNQKRLRTDQVSPEAASPTSPSPSPPSSPVPTNDSAAAVAGECWNSAATVRWAPYAPGVHGCDYELRFLRIEAEPAAPGQLRFCMRTGFHQRRIDFWRTLPIEENKETSWGKLLRPFLYLVGVVF